MTTYEFYGYAPGAIVIDEAAGTYTLAADFDAARDRVRFVITDDDEFLDGDAAADEVGDDANQTGVVSRPDGTVIASGRIYSESFVDIAAPDSSRLWLDLIEIDGVFLGFIASAPMVPGVVYQMTFDSEVDGSNQLRYDQVASIPCLLRGTPVETEAGDCPVERITPGTRLRTRDSGWQPVLWIGRRTIALAELAARPALRPVRILPGALGPGVPRTTLHVSTQHHVLLSGPLCELHLGVPEALAAAGHLVGMPGIDRADPRRGVTFFHLLLPRHEVIRTAGAWTESLLATDLALHGFGARAARAAAATLGADTTAIAARPRLRRWEVRAILDQPSRTSGRAPRVRTLPANPQETGRGGTAGRASLPP
jgi:hypothetical protein